MPRHDDLWGAVTGAHPVDARGPVRNVGVREIAEVGARRGFQETAAVENSRIRDMDDDVVARMPRAGEKEFASVVETPGALIETGQRLRRREAVLFREAGRERMGETAHAQRVQRVDAAGSVIVKMCRHGETQLDFPFARDPPRENLRLLGRPAGVDQKGAVGPKQDQAIGGIDEAADRMRAGVKPNVGRERRHPDRRADPPHWLDAEFKNGGEAGLVGIGGSRGKASRERPDTAGAGGRFEKISPGREKIRHLVSGHAIRQTRRGLTVAGRYVSI